MRVRWLLALVLVAGCDQEQLLSAAVSPDEQAFAKQHIDHLLASRLAEIEQATHPTLQAQIRDALPKMAELLPDQAPTSQKLIGFTKGNANGEVTTNLTYEYGFADEWFAINVAWLQQSDSNAIVGFNVYSLEGELSEVNRFTLAGKSAPQYALLVAAIVVPFFSVYALVKCATSRLRGRKWPWILFILFGVGTFAMNWTTGEWEFAPLRFQLLSAGVAAAPFGPWILSVSLPIGAVWFLLRRRKLTADPDADA